MSIVRKAPQPEKPDEGPWLPLGKGRFRSAQTGRLKYDPNQDPEWIAAIRRLAEEDAKRFGGVYG